jgi:hypothetical protein
VARRPDAHLQPAIALNSLSLRYADNDMLEQSLQNATESTATFRELSTQDTAACAPYLAEAFDLRVALEAVRTCFELGVWFHRAVTGDPTVRPFVPPPNPDTDHAQLNDEDHVQLNALHADLNRHRKRLAEVLMHPDHLGGDHLTRSRAGTALARAEADHEQLGRTVAHLGSRLAEVEAAFNDTAATPPPVSAADRDAFITSAREAAQWLTDIASSAVAEALNRRMQLEVATWTGSEGQTLTVTYTADDGFRVTGTLRPGCPVVDRPCPDRQSLMTVLADLERKGYQPADDEGTRVVRAVLLIPGALEFLSATDVTASPACPPWCVADHSSYVDWFHECRGPGLEMRSLDGQLIGAEPVRLTDACTGEVHEAMVRVCDTNLDPAAARQYAAAILAAAAMIDPLDPHTT